MTTPQTNMRLDEITRDKLAELAMEVVPGQATDDDRCCTRSAYDEFTRARPGNRRNDDD